MGLDRYVASAGRCDRAYSVVQNGYAFAVPVGSSPWAERKTRTLGGRPQLCSLPVTQIAGRRSYGSRCKRMITTGRGLQEEVARARGGRLWIRRRSQQDQGGTAAAAAADDG